MGSQSLGSGMRSKVHDSLDELDFALGLGASSVSKQATTGGSKVSESIWYLGVLFLLRQ